ncbi:polysaccharide biosynthesis protein [Prevotella sp.]|uniref:polysaccharide biosynthesis protein n=1 Tax=Prevotella sp. TaxID=59823 RepID=UPI0025FB2318|nr:nucleoside-diphosphate sugar epimerase/dehydratase [Prevotella sp.]
MKFFCKLSNWYFSSKSLPYWGVLFLDCLIVFFAGYVSGYLEHGGLEFAQHFWGITAGNLLCVLLFAVAFRLFHTYSGILRYSSLVDLERVGMASFVGVCMSYVLGAVLDALDVDNVVMSSLFGCTVMFVCASMLMWVERMFVRAMFDVFKSDKALPVAIYGTQNGGVNLANSIMLMKDQPYMLQAFISDGDDMRKTYLLGKKVFRNQKGIAGIMKALHVKVLFVSPLKSDDFRNNQQMIDEFVQAGIKIMMMTAAEEWDGKSDLSFNQLHEIEIEDLLPRDKIEVDMNAIGAMLKGKHVLITGAAGSIGSEMVRQVAVFKPAELTLIDQAETPMHNIRLMMARQFADVKNETIVGSITDKAFMEKIFNDHRPEYVFHAAAYKHVPMMEDNPAMAVRNNVNGTRVIADLAVKYGTKKFVMISTDKAVNPTNVMGCSKRICEIYCQSLNQAIVDGRVEGVTQFVTTRFGNVLGSNGSVIPIFKELIRKGGPVTVTHPDIIRYFMLIPEACKLVLEAGTMGKGGEIFVFDMGKPVKIVDLARRMISLSGAKNVEIKFTGLREGEKLYEELLSTKENTIPTQNPKIMVAKVREYDYEVAKKNEDELLQISFTHDDMAIVKKMKEIVPEYKSQVSKYQVLDK